METSVPLQQLIMAFVRDRSNFSEENFAVITDPANINQTLQYLVTVKRDVESQFIASRTRVQEFFAKCEEARRNGTDVDLVIESFEAGTKVKHTETLPPSEAYHKFLGREGRWKVKTVRYLALIETAITSIKNASSPSRVDADVSTG